MGKNQRKSLFVLFPSSQGKGWIMLRYYYAGTTLLRLWEGTYHKRLAREDGYEYTYHILRSRSKWVDGLTMTRHWLITEGPRQDL